MNQQAISGKGELGQVLVLDAAQRSALAAIRSLGRRGVQVIACEADGDAIGFRSRHCSRCLISPDPRAQPGEFLAWLQEQARVHPQAWILPATDLTMSLLLQHREAFPRLLAAPGHEAYERISDKAVLAELAPQAGFAIPVTLSFAATEPPGAGALQAFPFPAVVKQALSTFRTSQGVHRFGALYVDDAASLAHALAKFPRDPELRLILQQRVDGDGAGVFGLYHQGKRHAHFAHRRLREKPPSGGISVFSESVPTNARQLANLDRLAQMLCWDGVMMAEFKHAADQDDVLIEINGRLWGSLQLAIDAGVDFPWLLYLLSRGAVMPPAPEYRVGRRLRWWLGDLDSLYLRLRDARLTPTPGAKLRALFGYLAPRALVRDELLRFSDPSPGLFALRQYARALFKRS